MIKKSSYPELVKKFPPEVYKIFEIFKDDIRLVGGCVRDLLLNKKVNDFDFATKFLPEEILKILKENKVRAIPTGIKFGTVTAVVNSRNFEITTLRKDNETDGRHCKPEFVDSYKLDASRRDFTINALYLDSNAKIYDYFDGISDLESRRVRFIGNTNQRIAEDYLRILRFFRFSNRYAQNLDQDSLKACIANKKHLKELSRERIRQEFFKIILSDEKDNLIETLEVLKEEGFLAEISQNPININYLKNLFNLEEGFNFSASQNLKIAVLFIGDSFEFKNFKEDFCATNKEKSYLNFFAKNSQSQFNLNQLKKLLACEGVDLVRDLYLFFLVQNFEFFDKNEAKANLEFLNDFSLPKFPLKGDDLKYLVKEEREIGKLLKKAKNEWAKRDFQVTKEELINLIS